MQEFNTILFDKCDNGWEAGVIDSFTGYFDIEYFKIAMQARLYLYKKYNITWRDILADYYAYQRFLTTEINKIYG